MDNHPPPSEDDRPDSATLCSSTQPFLASSQISDLSVCDKITAPSVGKSSGRGRLRKARLAENKGVTRAEDVAEYRGQMPVDDLVEFINSGRTSQKNATNTTTIRKNVTRNNSKKRRHEAFETGSKVEVKTGRLTEGEEKDDKQDQGKTNSISNKGVKPGDDFDLKSEDSDVAWNDFTVVSRKRKAKTRPNGENSPNEMNFTSDIKGRTRFNRVGSPNEMNLTTQLNPSCPQVERVGKQKGNKQFKALMCEDKSFVRTVLDSSSREVTPMLDVDDTVISALTTTYPSSKNRNSISSQKLGQDIQIKRKDHSIHQPGGCDLYENGPSPETSAHSLSTKVTSHRNSESKSPASSCQCPPVVFTDRNNGRDFEKLVNISFGFDVHDAEFGLESRNCIANCSSALEDCRCSKVDVTGCTDKKPHDAKSQPVLLARNCIKENYRSSKMIRNTTAQSGTNSDSETKKVEHGAGLLENAKLTTVQCGTIGNSETEKVVRLLTMNTTTCQQNSTSRNGKVEKQHKADSIKEEKRTTLGALESTASANDNPDTMLMSDKRVNCITSSKKTATTSDKTKRVTKSESVGAIIFADPCTSLSCTGRPISVVAPNQMSKLLCSSGQSSSSGSSSSSGQSESSSSAKSDCPSQSFCSPSNSCHGSSVILGPCVRAPVVKVAPMLVEKQAFNEVMEATTKPSEEELPVCKSNAPRYEESTLEDDDQRTATCNTFSFHPLSFLTEGCEVTKLESGPSETDRRVHHQEPYSDDPDSDVHKQDLPLHKLDHDFDKQQPCLPQTTPSSLAMKPDETGADSSQGKYYRPLGNAFHLLSAQLYLYKCKLQSVCDFHFPQRFS